MYLYSIEDAFPQQGFFFCGGIFPEKCLLFGEKKRFWKIQPSPLLLFLRGLCMMELNNTGAQGLCVKDPASYLFCRRI